MTREEKVNLLNKLLEIEEKNDIGYLTSTDRREFQQWVEDLEQEPFMNKPCVSHQVCHEDKVKVLDKIRAEIEPKCDRINSLASALPYTAHREIQELLCEIMDLCKAESEPQEREE